MIRPVLLALVVLLLSACSSAAPKEVTFHATDNPEKLSEWGLFTVADGKITPHEGMVTYELNSPLFSDYAQKWRTIWMPANVAAQYEPQKAFDFPVGTIITKTFYYTVPASDRPGESDTVLKMTPAMYQSGTDGLDIGHVRMIETRLLVRRADGWAALPYVWNADQTEATLQRAGADVPLTIKSDSDSKRFTYSVPNANQCAGCHASNYEDRAIHPIGLKARHLNRDFEGPGGEINQLRRLVKLGYLKGVPGMENVPHNAKWDDSSLPIGDRARSYLDINCSHCHSETGPARVSGLWLASEVTDLRKWGVCKPSVAAGRGTGGRDFDILPGQPHQSILTYRLESTDPGEMMPEVGRSLEHKEGVDLVTQWISQLTDSCDVARAARSGREPAAG
ncbi:hypothetical protein F7D01_12950 [Erythrobacter sp. 3-20A1M]|uniref:SO2930 family diheme c-type cytochrome n=1 Tax=Erythrobacter sp. 3-20A1M TaxID=2653850 RepID=UPI001BFCAABD|nr:SO2930 family diheme c-type cytochrome [Erythrobacter sp. 3-20A1M]QWC57857.1 hypothetical protein F7D01_12950 [Erythrobacter sp. 3-20A1M]